MRPTSRYFFSLGLLLCSVLGSAQQKAKDTVPPKQERYGIRVGVDLYKLARSVYDKDYKGLELTGDYRLTRKYYLAAELGNENKTTDEDHLNFTTKGTFLKAGFDYNAHENWLNLENMIFVGLRYGVSSFSQELNSYSIYNPHPYFGESEVIVSGQKYKGLSAQWAEAVVGLKTEVFNNFFVGFSLRASKLISNKKPSGFDNLYIPGFNRTYDGDFGVGFNYTVSYFVPLYKKKVKKAKTEQKKK